jgi:hypothetical protein
MSSFATAASLLTFILPEPDHKSLETIESSGKKRDRELQSLEVL